MKFFKFFLFFFLIIVSLSFVLAVFLAVQSRNFHRRYTINSDIYKYIKAEILDTKLNARKWLIFASYIHRLANLTSFQASRLYAYVASVYDDVYIVTEDSKTASLAASQIVKYLYPQYEKETDTFLQHLRIPTTPLTSKTLIILDQYKEKAKDESRTWIIDRNHYTNFLPPPPKNSLYDRYEVEKVKFAINERKAKDLEAIYFWNGKTGIGKTQLTSALTLSPIWQNILFVEKGEEMSEKQYASAQKILAQSIADAYIVTLDIKYRYNAPRPSQRIKNLDQLVKDPDNPSYVSEYAAISKTAADILTFLFPEKENIWHQQAETAKNASLFAAVQFDFDNNAGEYLGTNIANEIIQKKFRKGEKYSTPSATIFKLDNPIIIFLNILFFKSYPKIEEYRAKIVHFSHLDENQSDIYFPDVIDKTGIIKKKLTGGASWADYNNDGYLDLFISYGDDNGDKLYRNNKNGAFTDVTRETGIKHLPPAMAGVFGDYDNDGCEDLYLVMSGPSYTLTSQGLPGILYHNNCDGTFSDVTKLAHIFDTGHGRGATWADYNNDGYLDLYVANHGIVQNQSQFTVEPNILYRNNSDGTFTNVTNVAGVAGLTNCTNFDIEKRLSAVIPGKKITLGGWKESFQPIFFDYNDDGWADLFVATDAGISPLYKNNGNGTFREVTHEAGMCSTGSGMGVTIGDSDGDLDFDLYVTNVSTNYLWQNNNNGTFTEVAGEKEVAAYALGWGTNFFDFDNDSFLDLYVVNGIVTVPSIQARIHDFTDKLYRNNGTGMFQEIAGAVGIIDNNPKLGAAFGDYDNDGFIDAFVVADFFRNKENDPSSHLYKNKGNKNNWITLQLTGTKSNRNGVGAKVKVTTGGKSQIQQKISGSSFQSQNSPWLTFGLGKYDTIAQVEIDWPSGIKQKLNNIKAKQKIIIIEK